jgi:hypothetical protein
MGRSIFGDFEKKMFFQKKIKNISFCHFLAFFAQFIVYFLWVVFLEPSRDWEEALFLEFSKFIFCFF